MFCGYCGHQSISNKHSFCTNCGEAFDSQDNSTSDTQEEYLPSHETALPEVVSDTDKSNDPNIEVEEEHEDEYLSSYEMPLELPPTEVLADTSDGTYSDIESESESISSAFEELDSVQTGPPIEPDGRVSKYLCVYWTGDEGSPWKALSLDNKFILGDFSSEEEAASVAANYHKVHESSLKVTTKWRDKRAEFRQSLIGKLYDPESDAVKEVANEISKIKEKPVDDKAATKEYFEAAVARKDRNPKQFYVSQFVSAYENKEGIKSWNWAAFLVGPVWYLYRKVYSLFLVLLFAHMFDYAVGHSNASEDTQTLSAILYLVAWIFCTGSANKSYYTVVVNKIEGMRILYSYDREKVISSLRNAPMVNEWVLSICMVVGLFALVALPIWLSGR